MSAHCASTLVIHSGGIGDFLLMCPTLPGLAAAGPLEVAGRIERVRLAAVGGIADAAHDLDSIDFASIFSEPSRRLADFASRFERVIVWMRDDGIIVQRLREMGISDPRVYPGLPPADWTKHASEYYLELTGAGRGRVPVPLLSIPPSPERLDIVIHCGSGGKSKNWPLDRFEAVAGALERAGRKVAWLIGPAEEDVRLRASCRAIRKEDLRDVASLLAAATLFVGNDSGMSHLAAAVGCPSAVIFGPTDPRVWAPQGNRVRVILGAPWPSVEQVVSAVGTMLDTA